VEFALAFPMFIALLMGLFDMSRMVFTYVSLANGAREMARSAAVLTTQSSANNASIVNSFNNVVTIMGTVKSTDTVCVYVDSSGATNLTDAAVCASPGVSCAMPLTTAGCTIPDRATARNGTIRVHVAYTFEFTPVFEAMIASVRKTGVTTWAPVLRTTAASYVE
jgi:Flp pilus assembly protein TadG